MEHYSSQETQLMNDSDLEYIMGDLRRGQQFNIFLHTGTNNVSMNSSEMWNIGEAICKQEYVDEICDSTQENGASNSSNPEKLIIAAPNDTRSPTGSIPCLDKYPGVYDFGVQLSSANNSRHAWVYSSKLDKVFIDVNKVLLFKFKLNTQNMMGLRVRALLAYIIPDHINNPVNRCTIHAFKCDPSHLAHARDNICLCNSFNLAGHVITANHANAEYDYNPESGRHSVIVPLDAPHAGSDSTTVAYQFGCKTSCPGGMSRRPINLIFTLETEHGQVVGRSVMPVKVCSCPKRDKEREENDDLQADPGTQYAVPRVPGQRRRAQHTERHSSSKVIKLSNSTQVPDQSLTLLFNQAQQMNLLLHRILELQMKQQEEVEEMKNKTLNFIAELTIKMQELTNKFQSSRLPSKNK